ncbi:SDR family NAD(P)-dependent oxidoreductase [Methyloceanibacter caenitepidi]|nr:SDR family NAD(P)-dependent oxidoreductase [Methyloceanibacter caenitepidi]
MVEAFAAQGAKVAFLDRDEEAGSALSAQLGGRVRFVVCDVADAPQLQAAIKDTAAALGGLQVLIANAANDTRHELDEVTPDLWDDCLAVNLKHQFFAAQAAYPAIEAAGGGAIICLGSISWLNNTTGMVGYTTAKAGIHGLVRTLARLLGPKKIRVNALLPGWTMTERQLERWVDEEAHREIDNAQCLPGRVMPDDIARMALFLAADDGAMCTHQTFVVDGGWI